MNIMDIVDMYEVRIEKLARGIYETSVCGNCGNESILQFGFASPCRRHGGSHRNITIVASTKENEAAKLWGAYHGCPSFDRVRFDESAPQSVKDLLRFAETEY